MTKEIIGLISGPILFLIIINILPCDGLSYHGHQLLGITIWMAIWWVLEVIPMAMTALLPLVLFPICGFADMKSLSSSYAHPILFLFIGGFILATAIEKWQLHLRIALWIIQRFTKSPKKLILGCMLSTYFLSMFLSNTATTIMIIPIIVAILSQLTNGFDQIYFKKIIVLSIAYSASIGGMATLIGTPTNLIFSGIIQSSLSIEVSFISWFVFAFPLSFGLLILSYVYLVFGLGRSNLSSITMNKKVIQERYQLLGRLKKEEMILICIFVCIVFGWVFRRGFINHYFPMINDSVIILTGVFFLFFIPLSNKEKGEGFTSLITWEDAVKIPWGIVLLFGGGLALASAFQTTGLAQYIGQSVQSLIDLPILLLLVAIVLLVNFLTEITSNMATVSMILPIIISISNATGQNPIILMIAATLAASCAFMLPVATAPNAIVFAEGSLRMKDMIRAGFGLNILSAILISIYVYFFAGLINV